MSEPDISKESEYESVIDYFRKHPKAPPVGSSRVPAKGAVDVSSSRKGVRTPLGHGRYKLKPLPTSEDDFGYGGEGKHTR